MRSVFSITSTSINISDYMEDLFGVRLEGQPPLYLVMDPDHPNPIPSALPRPRGEIRRLGLVEGSPCLSSEPCYFFSSVGLMNGKEVDVWNTWLHPNYIWVSAYTEPYAFVFQRLQSYIKDPLLSKMCFPYVYTL